MSGPPSGRREESVSFSLRELTKLEEDRLAREAREAHEREAAAARAREEAARREATAREDERRKALDDLARREAMQKALVEQARIEVEARTRAEEAERERRYELELARLRGEATRQGPGGYVASAAAGLVVAMLACAFAYVGAVKPAFERRTAELERSAAREGERAADLERRLEEARAALTAKERELAAAPSHDAPPTALPGPARGPTRGPTRRGGTRGSAPPAPAPTTCLPGDPLCPAIGGR